VCALSVRYDLAVVSIVRLRDGWNIKLQDAVLMYVGFEAKWNVFVMESRKVLLTDGIRGW
jgi:hypothetical protein